MIAIRLSWLGPVLVLGGIFTLVSQPFIGLVSIALGVLATKHLTLPRPR
jgi:hypothetical protein